MNGIDVDAKVETQVDATLYGEEAPVEVGTEVEILTLDEEDDTVLVKVLSGFLEGMEIWIDLDVLLER